MNVKKAREIFNSSINTIRVQDWVIASDDEIAQFDVSDKVKNAWHFLMTTEEIEDKPLYSTAKSLDRPTEWELRDGTAE